MIQSDVNWPGPIDTGIMSNYWLLTRKPIKFKLHWSIVEWNEIAWKWKKSIYLENDKKDPTLNFKTVKYWVNNTGLQCKCFTVYAITCYTEHATLRKDAPDEL